MVLYHLSKSQRLKESKLKKNGNPVKRGVDSRKSSGTNNYLSGNSGSEGDNTRLVVTGGRGK